MSVNIPYVEGTTTKLRRIMRYHKIRFTFYTEITLRILVCKSTDQVATGRKKIYIAKS